MADVAAGGCPRCGRDVDEPASAGCDNEKHAAACSVSSDEVLVGSMELEPGMCHACHRVAPGVVAREELPLRTPVCDACWSQAEL